MRTNGRILWILCDVLESFVLRKFLEFDPIEFDQRKRFEQRTTNDEQRTTNNEQRTTNNEQRTTNDSINIIFKYNNLYSNIRNFNFEFQF